jgi:ABC-type cobalamin/Fe3+-siderophores transport system ATPase subunit
MDIEISIKNYRCFPDSRPARITINGGFMALVGVNNSGKSSLLRFFYEFRPLWTWLSQLGNLYAALRGPQALSLASCVSDQNEIFHNQNGRDISIALRVLQGPDGTQALPGLLNEIRITISRHDKSLRAEIPGIYLPEQAPRLQVDGNTRHLLLTGGGDLGDLRLILDACAVFRDTLYLGPFRNAINVASGLDYYDISVGQAFITKWRAKKTGGNILENEAILRLTDDIRRIFGFAKLEIDASDDNSTLKLFVNDRSFKLTELGAGLTQFIMVLANAAISRPALILIDEPELNLHPSLQVDFLTSLASYSRQGMIFGTHCLGLARATATRIYSLRKVTEWETEVRAFEATPRLAEFLGEMSFSGYQELGYDKLLLVEGPTDVTTFQQFLRMYGKDHKIVILHLGGKSSINGTSEVELAELTRISPNITAIIDSEKTNKTAPIEASRLAFEAICKKLGITCHILERGATENYLADRSVKKVYGEKYRALAHFEELGALSPSWNKRENWRIAREMVVDDLRNTDLDRIIGEL